MSHFTTQRVKVTNQDLLVQAVKGCGLVPVTQGTIRGYNSQEARADIAVKIEQGQYDLGFKKQGEAFYAFADFGMDHESTDSYTSVYTHLQRILGEYAKLEALNAINSNTNLNNANVTVKVHG